MTTFLYVSPYQAVTLYSSSTPICRAPMWDHYGRSDCIRACEHGGLKQISLGPFVVLDLFVFPLHLLFHIYFIFLYPQFLLSYLFRTPLAFVSTAISGT